MVGGKVFSLQAIKIRDRKSLKEMMRTSKGRNFDILNTRDFRLKGLLFILVGRNFVWAEDKKISRT